MSRSAIAQTDFHDQNEQDFIIRLAKRLDEAAAGGETTSLLIVAAPRALGIIGHAYTGAVSKAVRAEVAKDYVNMPVYEIEKHLAPERAA